MGRFGPEPFTVAQARAAGLTRGRLRAAANRGLVRTVRPGLLVVADHQNGADPSGGTLALPLLSALSPRAVVSHESAAALLGLWTPRPLRRYLLEVTIPGHADRTDGRVRVHGSRLESNDVIQVSGVVVTSVARTALDLARGRSLPTALIPLDSALRSLTLEGAHTLAPGAARDRVRDRIQVDAARSGIAAALERQRGWPGVRAARAALEESDPASESAFESWSRGTIYRAGLPRPTVAEPVAGASGTCYWSDFAWRALGVTGEADGWSTYGADLGSFRTSLVAERSRQQDLEAAGWTVVRWTPDEPAAAWLLRLARALATRPASLP